MEFKNTGLLKVSEHKLLQQGFRINYATGHKVEANGHIKLFVYDHTIECLKNKTYLITGMEEKEADL